MNPRATLRDIMLRIFCLTSLMASFACVSATRGGSAAPSALPIDASYHWVDTPTLDWAEGEVPNQPALLQLQSTHDAERAAAWRLLSSGQTRWWYMPGASVRRVSTATEDRVSFVQLEARGGGAVWSVPEILPLRDGEYLVVRSPTTPAWIGVTATQATRVKIDTATPRRPWMLGPQLADAVVAAWSPRRDGGPAKQSDMAALLSARWTLWATLAAGLGSPELQRSVRAGITIAAGSPTTVLREPVALPGTTQRWITTAGERSCEVVAATMPLSLSGPGLVTLVARIPVAHEQPWHIEVLSQRGVIARGDDVAVPTTPGVAAATTTSASARSLPSRPIVLSWWVQSARESFSIRSDASVCLQLHVERHRPWLFARSDGPVAASSQVGHSAKQSDESKLWATLRVFSPERGEPTDALPRQLKRRLSEMQTPEMRRALWFAYISSLREIDAETAETIVREYRVEARLGTDVRARRESAVLLSELSARVRDASHAYGLADMAWRLSPLDAEVRQARVAAHRKLTWRPVVEMDDLETPTVTLLAHDAASIAGPNEVRSWQPFHPEQDLELRVAPPRSAVAGGEVALWWRAVLPTSAPAATLYVNGTPHSLAVRDGAAVTEILLRGGTHVLRWSSPGARVGFHSGVPSALSVSDAAAARDRNPHSGLVGASRLRRLMCDQPWRVELRGAAYARIVVARRERPPGAAVDASTPAPASGRDVQLFVRPDVGERRILGVRFSDERAWSTGGELYTQAASSVFALPPLSRTLEVGCGADNAPSELWVAVHTLSELPAGVEESVETLASATALEEATQQVQRTSSAHAHAERARILYALGFGELAGLDAAAAMQLAPADERASISKKWSLAAEPRWVDVPSNPTWWQGPSMGEVPQPVVCASWQEGGDPAACAAYHVMEYQRQHDWRHAVAAARAFRQWVARSEAPAATARHMHAVASEALQHAFHPHLASARALAARGTQSVLVRSTTRSGGTVSVPSTRTTEELTVADARRILLAAPWSSADGLQIIDHGAGISVTLIGPRRIRVGVWCEVLRVERSPSCRQLLRWNQQEPRAFDRPARVVVWEEHEVPTGSHRLTIDLVAPGRDRMLGVVLQDASGQPLAVQSNTVAHRLSAMEPLQFIVAGPTVVSVELRDVSDDDSITIDVDGHTLRPTWQTQERASGAAQVARRAEIPVLEPREHTIRVQSSRDTMAIVRLRGDAGGVYAKPFRWRDESVPTDSGGVPGRLSWMRPHDTGVWKAGVTALSRITVGLQADEESDDEVSTARLSQAMTLGIRRWEQPWVQWGIDLDARQVSTAPISLGVRATAAGALGPWRYGADARYWRATTSGDDPQGIVLSPQPWARVWLAQAEFGYVMSSPRWWLRPGLEWFGHAQTNADPDVDRVIWSPYRQQNPWWLDARFFAQWIPSVDARVSVAPFARLSEGSSVDVVGVPTRASGWAPLGRGSIVLGLEHQSRLWLARPAAGRSTSYWQHDAGLRVQWNRLWSPWWVHISLRAMVRKRMGRDTDGILMLRWQVVRHRGRSLRDMLPSEQEFDHLLTMLPWQDER